MRQISSKARTSRGATYIEISAVILLLALFAAVVSPSFVKASVGQRLVQFRAEALALCSNARESAIALGQSVQVSLNDDETALVATVIDAETQEPGQILDAQLPEAIRAVDGSGWLAVFEPDGSASEAVLEFATGQSSRYLQIKANGSATWQMEPPTDDEVRWEAGDIESRT